jgi:hypothetical protein
MGRIKRCRWEEKKVDVPELLPSDLLDPTDGGRFRVVAVVDDDGEVTTGEEQLQDDMRACIPSGYQPPSHIHRIEIEGERC